MRPAALINPRSSSYEVNGYLISNGEGARSEFTNVTNVSCIGQSAKIRGENLSQYTIRSYNTSSSAQTLEGTITVEGIKYTDKIYSLPSYGVEAEHVDKILDKINGNIPPWNGDATLTVKASTINSTIQTNDFGLLLLHRKDNIVKNYSGTNSSSCITSPREYKLNYNYSNMRLEVKRYSTEGIFIRKYSASRDNSNANKALDINCNDRDSLVFSFKDFDPRLATCIYSEENNEFITPFPLCNENSSYHNYTNFTQRKFTFRCGPMADSHRNGKKYRFSMFLAGKDINHISANHRWVNVNIITQ